MPIAKPVAHRLLPMLFATLLGGCTLGPDYRLPAVAVPGQWYAPLPHGASVVGLNDWWQQFNDPALATLLRLAEADSPSLDQALARIAQARATLDGSVADARPQLNGGLTKARAGVSQRGLGKTGTTSGATLDAAWELDLFGKLRRNDEASRNQLEARVDDWHDARVSLAAEVGDDFVQYRGCQMLVNAYRDQAQSQEQTARLTRLSFQAGFTSSADAALTDASAAASSATLINQQSACDVLLKSLVALTGSREEQLREVLGHTPARLPEPALLDVREIPTDLVRQRPDLASSERELAAANARIGAAQADRLPSLGLVGSFAVGNTSGAYSRTWSLGPQLSVPLFDGGKRRAAVDSARAGYDAALATYRQTLRTAVMEVEQSLVRLDAARRSEADAQRATEGYQEYFQAIDRNWHAGNASLLDRELARRSALSAQIELITLQQNQVRYWIALYKALGGGWRDGRDGLAAAASTRGGA
ncbi:efflux transporter outer membrane subunit [Pseudomonas batumici]|uniref:Outer membrane component of tripartite multidrug resistance system n=1 Tax=Pseudomonas batumici TaxID=226910 RepID=A0A0C2EYI1_9PSED|nr:efflux transporter outer membrane subunit [Pseudomonas batumici]KIH83868.1 Outer membrane component of tripartite multidrug resistance system [Pseudomonas batumici]